MKKEPDELSRARDLFLQRKYRDVIRHLAPQIFLYRDSAEYYRMMGIASLNVGDIAGAHSYFLRGVDIAGQDRPMCEGLAICSLFKKDVTEAARLWLLLQDRYPSNPKSIAGLKLLQDSPDRTDWPALIKEGHCVDLYPQAPFYWKRLWKLAGIVCGGMIGLAVIVVVSFSAVQAIKNAADTAFSKRLDADKTVLATAAAIPGDETQPFPKTDWDLPVIHVEPGELETLVQDMRTYFNQYRDNKVRRIINRILLSDAPEQTRQQALSLVSHIHEAKFTNFTDGVDFESVAREPWLHQGTSVRWSGRVSNLKITQEKIEFDFLPGYEGGVVSAGVVPVRLGFPVEIGNDMAVELIGTVLVDSMVKGKFFLKCTSIRIIRGNS